MKCIDHIKRIAATVGATIDEQSLRTGAIIIDAPAGYTWDANCATTICETGETRSQSWWTQTCDDVKSQMMMGLTKCTPAESADIEHERDEPWTAPTDAPNKLVPNE